MNTASLTATIIPQPETTPYKRPAPLVRLKRSLIKRIAKIRYKEGYKIQRYNNMLWLLNARNLVDKQILLFGGFEKEQIEYLLNTMQHGCDAFLDIGANFGLYSFQIAQSGFAKEIHAFEPDNRNVAQFMSNLYLNRLANANIHLHKKALSHETGIVSFELYPDGATGLNRVTIATENPALQRPAARKDATTVSIEAAPLDSVLPWQGKNIFLKIDVEGHERHVLQGAEKFLKENTCFLQIELWAENAEATAVILKEMGYRYIHRIDSDYYFTNNPQL